MILVPDKTKNIYPTSESNIRALLDFYFEQPDGEIEWLFTQKKFKLNQIQFVAEQISNNIGYFVIEFPTGTTISNLMKYGIDALGELETNWLGSKNRIRITKGFKEIVLKNSNYKLN